MERRIIFYGFLPGNEIAEVMAESDLAVVPKRASSPFGNEAASTKIMEFMALGVPVLASRTKIDTYYHDDSRLQFFESENEKELAEQMRILERDTELRERLVANALLYTQNNNWEEKKREYLGIVDSLACPTKAVPKAEAKRVSLV